MENPKKFLKMAITFSLVFLKFCRILYDIFSSLKLYEWFRDMKNLFWGDRIGGRQLYRAFLLNFFLIIFLDFFWKNFFDPSFSRKLAKNHENLHFHHFIDLSVHDAFLQQKVLILL